MRNDLFDDPDRSHNEARDGHETKKISRPSKTGITRIEIDEADGTIICVDHPVRPDAKPFPIGPLVSIPIVRAMKRAIEKLERELEEDQLLVGVSQGKHHSLGTPRGKNLRTHPNQFQPSEEAT